MLGTILSGRYHIISQLGQGGFGQTFLAKDMHLPGKPECVVKQLKPKTSDPVALQTAKRLFDTEAEVLYKLGTHPQIPRLFAHFEENQEFYLVQELIIGHSLTKEIGSGKQLTEVQTITLLRDILRVLEFVHQQQVIHRDIKPSNLIRRDQECDIVLIDFGAVKQISATVNDPQGDTNLTIAIGSPGYMASEQLAGTPQFNSDIYAVGMIGIEALTGLHPKSMQKDPDTGEISWQDQIQVSPGLTYVLDKMVCYDFRQRYQSATAVIADLKNLDSYASGMICPTSLRTNFTQNSTAKWTHQDPTSTTVVIKKEQPSKQVSVLKPKVTFNQSPEVKSPQKFHLDQIVKTLKTNWFVGVLIVMFALTTTQYWQLRSLLTKPTSNQIKSDHGSSTTSSLTQPNPVEPSETPLPINQPNQTLVTDTPSPLTPITPIKPSNTSQQPSTPLNPQKEQSEAISVILLANSTQQFFYSEHQQFVSQWENLSLNKPAQTASYGYKILSLDQGMAIVTATAMNPKLKSYTGVVLKTGESTICETKQPSIIAPGRPNIVGKTIQCPPGSISAKLF